MAPTTAEVRSIWITHPLSVVAIFYIAFTERSSGMNRPSFFIIVARDGTILVNGKTTAIDQAVALAQVARAQHQHVYLKHECSFQEVPPAGVNFGTS